VEERAVAQNFVAEPELVHSEAQFVTSEGVRVVAGAALHFVGLENLFE
jgi:hypothetical protein